MNLRLEMPFVTKQVRSGSVESWHLREGDHIDFGADLCDLLIAQVHKLDTAHPERMVPRRVSYRVRIRASESGVLRSIRATEGSEVRVGDLLAVVSTDPGESIDLLPDTPALRVVTDTTRAGRSRLGKSRVRRPLTQRGVKRGLRPAVIMFRFLAGSDSLLEERIIRALRIKKRIRRAPRSSKIIRGSGYVQRSGRRFLVVQSTANPQPRTGIYLRGACDLPTLFSLGPLLCRAPKGTVALADAAGAIAATRADVLLQTLEELPADATKEVSDWLRLPRDYFKPTLFSPTFALPGFRDLGEFPKTVVVLSLAPNVVRTLYRHREYGFLVDPGGWWLNQDLDVVLRNSQRVAWFRDHFEPVGRLSPGEFIDLFKKLIRLLRERAGPRHILVFNVLTVEPGDGTHNYQLRKDPEVMRRREFCLALVELSRELGFHIVDIDRVLKREGIDRQVDFAHFPSDLAGPIAAEVFDILRTLQVV
jgi:hypothetical protein